MLPSGLRNGRWNSDDLWSKLNILSLQSKQLQRRLQWKIVMRSKRHADIPLKKICQYLRNPSSFPNDVERYLAENVIMNMTSKRYFFEKLLIENMRFIPCKLIWALCSPETCRHKAISYHSANHSITQRIVSLSSVEIGSLNFFKYPWGEKKHHRSLLTQYISFIRTCRVEAILICGALHVLTSSHVLHNNIHLSLSMNFWCLAHYSSWWDTASPWQKSSNGTFAGFKELI